MLSSPLPPSPLCITTTITVHLLTLYNEWQSSTLNAMSLTPSPCNVWWAPITVRRREGEKEGEERRGGQGERQKRKEESEGRKR